MRFILLFLILIQADVIFAKPKAPPHLRGVVYLITRPDGSVQKVTSDDYMLIPRKEKANKKNVQTSAKKASRVPACTPAPAPAPARVEFKDREKLVYRDVKVHVWDRFRINGYLGYGENGLDVRFDPGYLSVIKKQRALFGLGFDYAIDRHWSTGISAMGISFEEPVVRAAYLKMGYGFGSGW